MFKEKDDLISQRMMVNNLRLIKSFIVHLIKKEYDLERTFFFDILIYLI